MYAIVSIWIAIVQWGPGFKEHREVGGRDLLSKLRQNQDLKKSHEAEIAYSAFSCFKIYQTLLKFQF